MGGTTVRAADVRYGLCCPVSYRYVVIVHSVRYFHRVSVNLSVVFRSGGGCSCLTGIGDEFAQDRPLCLSVAFGVIQRLAYPGSLRLHAFLSESVLELSVLVYVVWGWVFFHCFV